MYQGAELSTGVCSCGRRKKISNIDALGGSLLIKRSKTCNDTGFWLLDRETKTLLCYSHEVF